MTHPDWSASQFRTAFAARGLRHREEGAEAFAERMRPAFEAFARTLGGTARNIHATFQLSLERPGPPEPPAPPVAQFGWHVNIDVVPILPRRPTRTYAFEFEPIDGKLQGISRVNR